MNIVSRGKSKFACPIILIAALTIFAAGGAVAVDIMAFSLTVRTAQIRAEQAALTMALRLRQSGSVWHSASKLPYDRRVEIMKAGSIFPDDFGAVRVSIDQQWTSPISGSRRLLSVSATAAILPTDQPGETRVVTVL